VLVRLSRNLRRASPDETAMAMARARAIQQRFVPEAWDVLLGSRAHARSVLLRADRPDLLQALWEVDRDTAAVVTASDVAWREGVLHLRLEAGWRTAAGEPIALVREGGRLLRDLPEALRDALPEEVRDLARSLPTVRLSVAVRDRDAAVTWALPVEQQATWTELGDGRVALAVTASATLDPATAAFGAPIGIGVHDVVASLAWDDAERATSVGLSGPPSPVVLEGGTAVAYASKRGTLALDTSATLRNVLADGGAPAGPVRGSADGVRLALPRVAVDADADLPAAMRLTPEDGESAPVVLLGRLRADGGIAVVETAGTRDVPDGGYALAFRLGDGAFVGARRAAVVRGVLTIGPRAGTVRQDRGPRRLLGRVLRRRSS
jgi:hypothetical protein